MSCGQTDLHPECLAAIGEQLGGPMLIPGSATYGEEAAMISTIEPGDRVLTVNSGSFGQVLTELVKLRSECSPAIGPPAARCGAPCERSAFRSWLQARGSRRRWRPASTGPTGFELGRLQRILLEEYGLVVGNARIGTMGFVAERDYAMQTIAAFEHALPAMGWHTCRRGPAPMRPKPYSTEPRRRKRHEP